MKNRDAESIPRSLCSSSHNSADFKGEVLRVFLVFRHVGIEHLLNDVRCNVLMGAAFMLGDEALCLVFDVLFSLLDDKIKTREDSETNIEEVQHGKS